MTTKIQYVRLNRLVVTVRLLSAFALLAFVMALPASMLGQDHSGHAMGQETKTPQNAQEHRERAEQYKKKATEYRQEAEAHKKMVVEYSKGVVRNPKDTSENAYIKKMRLHCEKYNKAAEALAQEADEMGKYHTMRAKEMEGK